MAARGDALAAAALVGSEEGCYELLPHTDVAAHQTALCSALVSHLGALACKILMHHEPAPPAAAAGGYTTVLVFAARCGNEEVCRHLLGAGADPAAFGGKALQDAESMGHEAVCRLLREHMGMA
jgi:hypothetical protein